MEPLKLFSDKWIKKNCGVCSRQFSVTPCRKETAKYCSRKCGDVIRGASRKRALTKLCDTCSKSFKYFPSENSRRFCSVICRKITHKSLRTSVEYRQRLSLVHKKSERHIRGSSHWNWKGGIYLKNFYPAEFNKKLKFEVFKRDNFTCQICKVRGGSLVAHHIDENKKNNKMNNFQTLHNTCHARYHALKAKLGTAEGKLSKEVA